MVAPLLHLHEGARASGEFGHQVRRGLPRRHDVGYGGSRAGLPIFGLQLVVVAQHAMDVGEVCPAVRVDLRGAAGNDDADVRTFTSDAADRLAGLTFRLGCHRAGVDDHRAGACAASCVVGRKGRASPRSHRY